MHSSPEFALYERIYLVVEQVPHAMVTTYGDVATIVGGGCDARTVGYALGDLPQERAKQVPWQRVVAHAGGISTHSMQQRQLLEDEGVAFDSSDRVIMARFRWQGPSAEWATAHRFNTLPPRNEGEQLTLF